MIRTLRTLTLVAAAFCLPAIVARAGEFSFTYDFKDTHFPEFEAALDGALYGTTTYGPITRVGHQCRCGILFKVTPDGQESVVHAFTGGSDGKHPFVISRSFDRIAGLALKTDSSGEIVYGFDEQGHQTIYYANRPGLSRPEKPEWLG